MTGNLTVKAVFTKISIYTVTVNYYYHNNSANQDVTFDKEIFQLEEQDLLSNYTHHSTEVKREENSTLTADAILCTPQETSCY